MGPFKENIGFPRGSVNLALPSGLGLGREITMGEAMEMHRTMLCPWKPLGIDALCHLGKFDHGIFPNGKFGESSPSKWENSWLINGG